MSIVKTGQILPFTAPVGGVTVDVPVLIGGLLVIPQVTADAGDPFEGYLWGLFRDAPKASGAWSEGDPLYWDDTAGNFSTVDSVGPLVGSAAADALSGDATGSVFLQPAVLGMSAAFGNTIYARQKRVRATVAQINAGYELLPAVVGYKIRLLDVIAIAYGGAVGATTTVDVLGTQAASGVKLITFAQASLTQSTALRPGVSGVVVLANGAGLSACDENTAVTAGKTGADLTTATGVDFILTYALDAA